MIKARIIADSINPDSSRITTFLLTYPRFIHSEFMTHRVFSRNAASSRAIPIDKVLASVADCPAMPVRWGRAGTGMQDHGELPTGAKAHAQAGWLRAMSAAVEAVKVQRDIGTAKQIANRIVEPWSHITVLATATDLDGFFRLRAHKDAQPEFQVLAYMMLGLYLRHVPRRLQWGQWHVPFARSDSFNDLKPNPHRAEDLNRELVHSVASCARTSYVGFDKQCTDDEQRALFDRLRASGHWSPFEHQAQANAFIGRSGNFTNGWVQYRQVVVKDSQQSDRSLLGILADMPEWVRTYIDSAGEEQQ
jgi:hypothetical protein